MSFPPDDLFESPKILVDGAKEDIRQIKRLVRAYTETARCVPIDYTDPETGHKFIKLRIVDIPPPRIRYLASGILNNLRHSLDQASNTSAVALRKGKRDGYFPFGKDKAGADDVAARHCKTYPPELTTYLLTFKPYGGGDDLLYALSNAAGPNKHQITVHIQPELKSFIANDFIREFRGPGELGMLGWDNKSRELTFAHLKGAGAHLVTQIDQNTRLPFHVEIGGSSAFSGHEATALLDTLISKVKGIVAGIEAETARILAGRP